MKELLAVKGLKTVFSTGENEVMPVADVSFSIGRGETLGIVGESGCGKSVTSASVMRLLGRKGRILSGEICFDGRDLVKLSEEEMRQIRGNRISMIFQEPMTSLNPVFKIGYQLTEAIRLHLKMDGGEAENYAVEMLNKVGIPRAKAIFHSYPHTLSGGMRQRVMIAMALSCKPQLLIADEPTTALDVTIQAQILDLIKKLRQASHMSVMLITHDLGVIAEMADRVIVMYAGQVVEEADVFTLFENPQHPYTRGLIHSIPHIDDAADERLISIPGTVPSLLQPISGCRFRERCDQAGEACAAQAPSLLELEDGHRARCWQAKKAAVRPCREVACG